MEPLACEALGSKVMRYEGEHEMIDGGVAGRLGHSKAAVIGALLLLCGRTGDGFYGE